MRNPVMVMCVALAIMLLSGCPPSEDKDTGTPEGHDSFDSNSYHDSDSSASSDSDTGDSASDDSASDDSASDDSASGDSASGDSDTGDSDTGDSDTGDSDTGGEDSGDSAGGDSGGDDSGGEEPPRDGDGDGYAAEVDCDDDDATVHPAAEEVCGDGVDNDCDGTASACAPSGDLDADAADLTLVSTGLDRMGADLAWTDFDADGESELLIGAFGVDYGSVDGAGAIFVIHGPVTSDHTLPGEADGQVLGQDSHGFVGQEFSTDGDVDGDGIADLVVSNLNAAGPDGAWEGASHLFYGGRSLDGDLLLWDSDMTWTGDDDDPIGAVTQIVTDLDGDGLDDLALGSSNEDDVASLGGVVYLMLGAATRVEGEVPGSADAWFTVYGEASDYLGGWGTVVGGFDMDGDGLGDLIVGAVSNDSAGTYAGAAALLTGDGVLSGRDSAISISDADAFLLGDPGDFFGAAPGGVGDQDGDGLDDVLISSKLRDVSVDDEGGVAWVFSSSDALTGTLIAADVAMARFDGTSRVQMKSNKTLHEDVDGDGVQDMLIGASASDTSTGGAYLFLGPAVGTRSVDDADARILGDRSGDKMGSAVLMGDLNADGAVDLLIGASTGDVVYAFLGGAP